MPYPVYVHDSIHVFDNYQIHDLFWKPLTISPFHHFGKLGRLQLRKYQKSNYYSLGKVQYEFLSVLNFPNANKRRCNCVSHLFFRGTLCIVSFFDFILRH